MKTSIILFEDEWRKLEQAEIGDCIETSDIFNIPMYIECVDYEANFDYKGKHFLVNYFCPTEVEII